MQDTETMGEKRPGYEGHEGNSGEITPVGLIDQETSVCALFHYGDHHQMSIRWYFEFVIPKIMLDWGWKDYGVRDDEVAFRLE